MTLRGSAAQRDVSVRDHVIIKVQPPPASRRERLRTLAGREVGRRTGLFTVPEVVAFDDARGEIVFERLPLVESAHILTTPAGARDFAARAGEALAAIHRHLPHGAVAQGIDDVGAGPGPVVPLHGDFALANIAYLGTSDRLAIIDWTNADWIGTDADVGPPEVDVAVFLMSLFHRRLFLHRPHADRQAIARHFLAAYNAASPYEVAPDRLGAIVTAATPRFNQLMRRQKGGLRALGYRHSMIHLRFFLRRLADSGFDGHESHPA